MNIKIPKLRQINSVLKSLDVTDVYNLAMCDLATHHVKNALVYLVLYVHKTGTDLSKELLKLSHNPSSLQVSMKMARALEYANSNRLNLKFDTPSDTDVSSKPRKSSSGPLSDMRSKVIHEMNKRSLTGINVVLVDKRHNVYRYHYNDLSSIPQADLGLDLIKNDLMLKANGSSHNISGFDDNNNDDKPRSPFGPKMYIKV